MTREYEATLDSLVQLGWSVERLSQRQTLPDEILKRYPGMPLDHREFVETTGIVASPSATAWLVTSCVFTGTSDLAYAWNEWEQQSLEAAEKDLALRTSIERFWDRHLPIVMSVKSGYAYLALDLNTLQIVRGEEPLYEESSLLASSLHEMFSLVVNRDPRVQRWV